MWINWRRAALVVCGLLPVFALYAPSGAVQAAGSGTTTPLSEIEVKTVGASEVAIPRDAYNDKCKLAEYNHTGHNLVGLNRLDQPIRFFRDYRGKLHIVATNSFNLVFIDSDSDFDFSDIHQRCVPAIDDHSHETVQDYTVEPVPEKFQSLEWLLSTYTLDGKTVYGYIHNELHGEKYDPLSDKGCKVGGSQCWYASITKYVSTNGGYHFDPVGAPGDHLLMASIDTYRPFVDARCDGKTLPCVPTERAGIYGHSNVFQGPGRYYYMLANRIELSGNRKLQPTATCLLRSTDLKSWTSWQGYGKGFAANLVNPYTSLTPLDSRSCAALTTYEGARTPRQQSVTYHPALDVYVSIVAVENPDDGTRWFAYMLSRNLVQWTTPRLLRPQRSRDGAVLIDHRSRSLNFDVTGASPYLYFGAFCGQADSEELGAHCVRRQRMQIGVRGQ